MSKHLRVLRNAGLATYEPQAQRRVYRLRLEPMLEAEEWMQTHIDAWRHAFDALGRHLDTIRAEEERNERDERH